MAAQNYQKFSDLYKTGDIWDFGVAEFKSDIGFSNSNDRSNMEAQSYQKCLEPDRIFHIKVFAVVKLKI